MKTTQVVRKFLSKSRKYRDDDRLLRLAVWREFGFVLTPEQREIYMGLPADGVISRRRRELRGEFPESANVMEKRYNQFKEITEEKSKGSWLGRRFRSAASR